MEINDRNGLFQMSIKTNIFFYFKLGFDGGMEQYFLVTVTDRTSGEVAYNQTTTKLDLLVTNLSAGSSYLVKTKSHKNLLRVAVTESIHNIESRSASFCLLLGASVS